MRTWLDVSIHNVQDGTKTCSRRRTLWSVPAAALAWCAAATPAEAIKNEADELAQLVKYATQEQVRQHAC